MAKFVPFVFFASANASALFEGLCYEPVDVVQVQDATSSFDDRWPAMAHQIEDVIRSIHEINPDSRLGFATFGDKPLEGPNGHILGYPDDYCLHVDVQISDPSPARMRELFQHYTEHAQGGGGDWPEGVLEGLQRAIVAPQMGWQTRRTAAKIVVVVTDATTHLPGDALRLAGLSLPPNILTPGDLGPNENALCGSIDYPSLQQIADLVNQNDFTLIFLVAPGGSFGADGRFSPAASLANYGKKYWTVDGLQLWYEDQLRSVGVEAIVQTLDPEMKVYAAAFKQALERYRATRCTTPEPTTTPTTTPEPTGEATTDGDFSTGDSTTGSEAASTATTEVQTTFPTAPTTRDHLTDGTALTDGGGAVCCGDCCHEDCGCGFSEVRIEVNVVFEGGSQISHPRSFKIPSRLLLQG